MSDRESAGTSPAQFSILMLLALTAWLGVVVNLFWQMKAEFALLFSVVATVALLDAFLLARKNVTRWRIRRLAVATVSMGLALAIISRDDRWAKEQVFAPHYNRQAERIAGDLSRHMQGSPALANVKISVQNFKGHRTISVAGSVPDGDRLKQLEQVVARAVPPGRLSWGVVAEDQAGP